MAQKKLRYTRDVGGVLTDADSVVLRDPTGAFGIKRTDTGAIVTAAGTAFTHISTGVYEFTFTEPAAGLQYEYWIERVYNGETKRTRQFLDTSTGDGTDSGGVPSAPANYVTLGIQQVACGDVDLEAFLETQADACWALHQRHAPALDLHYQYFVLEMITLAQDRVRNLIETEIGSSEMQETGYSDSTNQSDSSTDSNRSSNSDSVQTASSSGTSSRTSSQNSSSSMTSHSEQTTTSTGSSNDSSDQVNNVDSTGSGSQNSNTRNTPYLHATRYSYLRSAMDSSANSYVSDNFERYNIAIPFIGSLSGQDGAKIVNQPSNLTTNTMVATESTEGHRTQKNKVIGDSDASNLQLTDGEGSRTNDVTRAQDSNMVGSGNTVSQSQMTSSAASLSHRESSSVASSRSLSTGAMTSTSTSTRRGAGASNMVSTDRSDRQYYNQLFEALQQMWKDTQQQIKDLEMQMGLAKRYLIQKLPTKSSQQAIINGTLSKEAPIARSPNSPFPFGF